VLFCVVGAYSLRGSAVDVALMGIFGVLGWGARKIDLDPAPFLLAFVLGALFETSIRQALLIGIGNPAIFVTRPIAATLLALAALVLLWPIVRWSLRRRAGAPGS
jgi:putative tricarboxylic transport membrane protein